MSARKKFFGGLVFALFASSQLGCNIINSYGPSTPQVTGECWYTKRGFFGSTTVWYCDGKGTCKEAAVE